MSRQRQEEVHRLNSIVEQFLSLARPLQLNREEISVSDYLQELAALIAAEARSSAVNVNIKVAGELPAFYGDRNYLKQLLLNLILNGIQAMPEGGTLSIEARAVRDRLELAVVDEGTGIDPGALTKIFTPYFTTKARDRVSAFPSLAASPKRTAGRLERRMIKEALARAGGVQTRAAELLGITERALRYKLAKYGLREGNADDLDR